MAGSASDAERDVRTRLTEAANRAVPGEHGELDRLLEANYARLRAQARWLMRGDRVAGDLEPTALLHLAYERLLDASRLGERGSVFFRACAARAMRRILVEQARAAACLRRGGDLRRKTALTSGDLRVEPIDVVELGDQLDALERFSASGPRLARIVEMRVFGGLTVPECAEALGVSPRTVDHDWRIARDWLRERLASP